MSQLVRSFEERVNLELKELRAQVQELSRATAGLAFKRIVGGAIAGLTTTPQDMPSMSLTADRPGRYLVIATFDTTIQVGSNASFVGGLVVSSGTLSVNAAVFLVNTAASVDRDNVPSIGSWNVTDPAATIKMQASKSVAAGTVDVNQSALMIIRTGAI